MNSFRTRGVCLMSLVFAVLAGCQQQPPPAATSAPAPTSANQIQASGGAITSSENKPDGWVSVKSADGLFTAQMPGEPNVDSKSVKIADGNVELSSYKVQAKGVFWNMLVVDYPQAVIDKQSDLNALLKRTAKGSLKQKPGSEEESLRTVEGSPFPTIEHRFHYPPGKTPEGQQYESGHAVYKIVLVGNRMCQLFINVSDDARDTLGAQQVESDLKRFFDSLVIPEQEKAE
jgi:hypothetical protein